MGARRPNSRRRTCPKVNGIKTPSFSPDEPMTSMPGHFFEAPTLTRALRQCDPRTASFRVRRADDLDASEAARDGGPQPPR
jgi:hypothetical protein